MPGRGSLSVGAWGGDGGWRGGCTCQALRSTCASVSSGEPSVAPGSSSRRGGGGACPRCCREGGGGGGGGAGRGGGRRSGWGRGVHLARGGGGGGGSPPPGGGGEWWLLRRGPAPCLRVGSACQRVAHVPVLPERPPAPPGKGERPARCHIGAAAAVAQPPRRSGAQ